MKANNRIDIYHDVSISNRDLVMCLLGFMESEDCLGEEAEMLVGQAIGRIFYLRAFAIFWFSGLLVTNLLWGLHFLGYL